jgi:hypothetical protein
MRFAAVLFAAVLAFGCSKTKLEEPVPPKADPGTSAVTVAAPKPESETCAKSKVTKTYGAKLQGTDIVEVGKVLAEPDRFSEKTVLVQGRVRSACSRKGCWMELAESTDKEAAGTRVTFKDYGFFVPTTSAGKIACVEGVLTTRRVAPEEVAHMEAEGARFPKKMSDGSAHEVRIVASGVEMWDDRG